MITTRNLTHQVQVFRDHELVGAMDYYGHIKYGEDKLAEIVATGELSCPRHPAAKLAIVRRGYATCPVDQ